jgi:hypothetical protein
VSDLELRVEALEAQMKALVDLFRTILPEAEVEAADPFSAAFEKFRQRAEERVGGVLR